MPQGSPDRLSASPVSLSYKIIYGLFSVVLANYRSLNLCLNKQRGRCYLETCRTRLQIDSESIAKGKMQRRRGGHHTQRKVRHQQQRGGRQ